MDTQPPKTSKKDLIIVFILLFLVLGIGAYLIFSRNQRPALNRDNLFPESVLPKTQKDQDTTNKQTLGQDEVEVFFVDLENKSGSSQTIGCGDSMAPITRTLNKNGKSTIDLIKTTLGFLFEPKEQYVGKGGLYNALYQSDLAVDKIILDKGTANVYLTGTYKLGGVCDDPRFEAQIKQTVLQFPEVKSVVIFVNGTQLNLSQK